MLRTAVSSALGHAGRRAVPPLGARFLGVACAVLGASAVSGEDRRQAVVRADEGEGTTPTPGMHMLSDLLLLYHVFM